METLLKDFYALWLAYFSLLDVEHHQTLDRYVEIMRTIKDGTFDLSTCKTDFVDIIELLLITIGVYKFGEEYLYEDRNIDENDKDLTVCYKIKTYLNLAE